MTSNIQLITEDQVDAHIRLGGFCQASYIGIKFKGAMAIVKLFHDKSIAIPVSAIRLVKGNYQLLVTAYHKKRINALLR